VRFLLVASYTRSSGAPLLLLASCYQERSELSFN
jgi:hypothetical protein